MSDDPTPPEKAPDTARERSPGEKETGENDLEGAPPEMLSRSRRVPLRRSSWPPPA